MLMLLCAALASAVSCSGHIFLWLAGPVRVGAADTSVNVKRPTRRGLPGAIPGRPRFA